MQKLNLKSLLICCLCFAGISCTGQSDSNRSAYQELTEMWEEVKNLDKDEYKGLDNADLSLIPVKQDGKCGYINLKGEYVIKPQFADADYFREGLAWVKSADGKVGYIGKDGNYVIAAKYAHGTPFSEGLAFVMSADDSAPVCIDTKGNAKFTLEQGKKVYPFYKGLANIRNADGYSSSEYVDKSGKVVSEKSGEAANKLKQFNERYVERFYEGLYPFPDRNTGKWGYCKKGKAVDKNDKRVINQQFDKVYPFGDVWAEVEIVINPQFDEAGPFCEGLGQVRIGEKWGFIDKKGKMVINPQFRELKKNGHIPAFLWGLAIVAVGDDWKSQKWGLIDKTGAFVISPQCDDDEDIMPFDNEGRMFAVRVGDRKTGKWGVIDRTGKYVINPQFDAIATRGDNIFDIGLPNWHEGLLAVRVGDSETGKWGFIDEKGEFVINPQFDEIQSFQEGLAAVRVGDYYTGKWGFIDEKGKIVVNPQFDEIEMINEELIAVCVEGNRIVNDIYTGKWGVIDKKGKFVINPQLQGEIRYLFWCNKVSILSNKVVISKDSDYGSIYGIMDIQNKTVVNNLKFEDMNLNYRESYAGFHIPNDFKVPGYYEGVREVSMFSQPHCE